ncbi:MAG: SLC13 family permease [Lentimicrobiaceae bacterium]|jgi:sodium-dependent dicarboxylate transporter 2/3/5
MIKSTNNRLPSLIPNSDSKSVALWAGPIVSFLIIFFYHPDILHPEIGYTLAIAAWMAIWWISEAVPLAITSLLPVALFPLLGVMDGQTVSSAYFNYVIFLFIGGFLMALAMQRWNLHKRIALSILSITGTGKSRLLLGFMLTTALLSMWMSNTATSMMIIPILLSVLMEIEPEPSKKRSFSTGILLGVAYSASIGGIMTLVGTPPNLSFLRIYQVMFPQAPAITFLQWMLFAVPVGILLIGAAYILLYLKYARGSKTKSVKDLPIRQMRKDLSPMSREEKIVLVSFLLMALLWITRSDIETGTTTIKGWASLFGNPAFINDGTIAIALSLPLFMIPSKSSPGSRIMDWETASHLPWDIVLLFGGGFALANGFRDSGLSLWLGSQLQGLSVLHPIIIILIICLIVTFLTELTSNTAVTEMILPVLAGMAIATHIHPLFLMVPATLSASMAFMLPAATPPNAIIFGTKRVTILEMAKTGLLLNLLGAVIITFVFYIIGSAAFKINPGEFPLWAIPSIK